MHRSELECAIDAAKKAGELLIEKYGRVSPNYKQDKTIYTDADIESEKLIKDILLQEFGDYGFLGEESGHTITDSDFTWVIDPLDGTTNYCIKNPFFNVSIGLAYRSEPVLGVVYYPVQDELFHARKNKGAYLNSDRIRVSDQSDPERAVFTYCHASDPQTVERMAIIWRRLKLMNPKVRQIGAGALELAYVAAGRIESFMMLRMNPWDVTAGTVLVREAGGKVTDFSGNEFTTSSTDILATNSKMHKSLLRIIHEED